MNLVSSVRRCEKRLRYGGEGGAPWQPLELRVPLIGEKYSGCKGFVICFTLSEDERLHSTALVGNKCKGGIWHHKFTVENLNEEVIVRDWCPIHVKRCEVGKSVQERRNELDELIGFENLQNGCEEQKKSLLNVKDVNYFREDIHSFKICCELYITKHDGKVMLWERTFSNLFREPKPAKGKKRSEAEPCGEMPAKHLRLTEDGQVSHLINYGSSCSGSFSHPEDIEFPILNSFQDSRTIEQSENHVPFQCRSYLNTAVKQDENIPIVVEEYDESIEDHSRQVLSGGHDYEQNLEVVTARNQDISYPTELEDPVPRLEYAGQRLNSVYSVEESTALASFAESEDPTSGHCEGWYNDLPAVSFDSSYEEYIAMTSAEDRDNDIKNVERILRCEAPTSLAVAHGESIISGCENAESLESMLQWKTITSSAVAYGGSTVAGCENAEISQETLSLPYELRDVECMGPTLTPEEWEWLLDEAVCSGMLSTDLLLPCTVMTRDDFMVTHYNYPQLPALVKNQSSVSLTCGK